MEVSFNPSVSALKAAVTSVDNTAHSIANANTEGFKSQRLIQSEGVSDTVSLSAAGYSSQDITRDISGLTAEKHVYGANLKLISMQNKMMGEIIDLLR